MGIREVMERFAGKEEPEDDVDDDVTTDKYLRSLRRERRRQIEELEKKQLVKQIADFKRDKMRRELYGIKEGLEHKKRMVRHKKVGNIMKAGCNPLKENCTMLKGKKVKRSKSKSLFI